MYLHQIRLYPRDCKLDNTFASVARVPYQILLLNTFVNLIIVLCADSHIVIYSIQHKNVQHGMLHNIIIITVATGISIALLVVRHTSFSLRFPSSLLKIYTYFFLFSVIDFVLVCL